MNQLKKTERNTNTPNVQRKEQVEICAQVRYWTLQPVIAVCVSDMFFPLVVVLNPDV